MRPHLDNSKLRETLLQIHRLIPPSPPTPIENREKGRNLLTRTIDFAIRLVRKHVPPLHWVGMVLSAFAVYFYVQLVVWTSRFRMGGKPLWPALPPASILALWHCNLPSILVAAVGKKPASGLTFLVATDPRGDFLALLCRLLGLQVVRGDSQHRARDALFELAAHLKKGSDVVIAVDGEGPARVAKVGAVILSASTQAPIITLGTDCRPAITQFHKWDQPRNPVPFGRIAVLTGAHRTWPAFQSRLEVEAALAWLQSSLDEASAAAQSLVSEQG